MNSNTTPMNLSDSEIPQQREQEEGAGGGNGEAPQNSGSRGSLTPTATPTTTQEGVQSTSGTATPTIETPITMINGRAEANPTGSAISRLFNVESTEHGAVFRHPRFPTADTTDLEGNNDLV